MDVVKNILGKPRKRGGKSDLDGDGVPNWKDCQPRNTMRQDEIDNIAARGLSNITKKFSKGDPQSQQNVPSSAQLQGLRRQRLKRF